MFCQAGIRLVFEGHFASYCTGSDVESVMLELHLKVSYDNRFFTSEVNVSPLFAVRCEFLDQCKNRSLAVSGTKTLRTSPL